MQDIERILSGKIVFAIKQIYNQDISPNQIIFQKTKKEFEGDITKEVEIVRTSRYANKEK